MYKCGFIYMQTRGCCVFMCKWALMVLHVLDHTEIHICTRPVTFSSVNAACCVCNGCVNEACMPAVHEETGFTQQLCVRTQSKML